MSKRNEIETLHNELAQATQAFADERATWILQRYVLMLGLEGLTTPGVDANEMVEFAEEVIACALSVEVSGAVDSPAIRHYMMPTRES